MAAGGATYAVSPIISSHVQLLHEFSVSNAFHFFRRILLKFRLPWTTGDPGALMENLVTIKIEYSVVDMRFVRYMCHRSPLKNLSLRGSRVGLVSLLFFDSPHRPPPPGSVRLQQLKVLDLSDTGEDTMKFLREFVEDNVDCKLTHLYLERCPVLPFSAYHVTPTIQFLSVAGYQPSRGYLINDLRAWARLSSMKEINASGMDRNVINETTRDSLVRQHPNVVFDLSEDFRESPRYF
jgi:hypothetical protein